MNELKQFSISDIHEVSTENSEEFCYAKICVLSTKPNSHKVLITDEILRRDGISVRGKWIVCDFNGFDATTHTAQEKIVGIVPHDAKIDFVEEDGYTSMYVDAIISKIYAKEIYDMFKIHNFRNVSVEMMTNDEDELPNGDIPIKGLKIVGITILGLNVNGSCPNANMSIIKFSVDDAEKYYYKYNKPTLKELAQQRIEQINIKEFSQEDSLNINNIDNERKEFMEDKNLNLSESENKEEDIIMEEPNEVEKDEKEMSEDSKAEDKEDKAEEEKEMGCGEKEMSEDSEIEEEDKDEDEEEEKKFSLDAYVDQSAILAMLENETEERRNLVNQVVKEFSAEEILKKFIEMSKENELLKSEKEFNDNEKKEKKFSAIMASVKEDLDEKTFSELSNEGKELALDQLGAFENKVKAFAYEATKNKKDNIVKQDNIMMFGGQDSIEQDSMDVFERISKK